MAPQSAPKITDLISKAVSDAQRLANAQIALARTEISASGERIGKGSLLGVAGAVLIGLSGFFLLFTLVYVLVQLGLPTWAGFLIVTLLLMAGGAVALLLARKSFEQVKAPSATMSELEKTREALLGPAADTTPAS